MNWQTPSDLWWLLALLPLWLMTGLLIRWRKKQLGNVIDESLWSVLLPRYSIRRLRVKNFIRLLALGFIILAWARPQWGFKDEEIKQRGLSILVALDTSRSMLAQDIKPSRLKQTKWGVRDLTKELKGDRIGIVAFAGDAFLQCPATLDYAAFLMTLDDVYSGIVPLGGTDLEKALRVAMKSFEKEKDDADKVIILISDGESTTGNPMALIPELKRAGIRLFCIGVGTKEGEIIQTSKGMVKDEKGNVIKSRLDEKSLEELALSTGGFYIRSAPGDFGLERVYRQGLAPLQRTNYNNRNVRVWNERFPLFLGFALVLLFIETLIRPTRKGEKK